MGNAIMINPLSSGGSPVGWEGVRSMWGLFGDVNSNGGWDDQHPNNFPEAVVIPNAPNCVYAVRLFVGNFATKHITLGGFSTSGVNLFDAFRDAKGVQDVTLENDIYPLNMGNWTVCNFGTYDDDHSGFFGNGRINMTFCTNAGNFGGEYIRYISFVENTIKVNFGSSGFGRFINDTSLISVANGLNETNVATLTMHTNAKTRMQTLMGNVSMDSGNTYHIFTEDSSGTTTLQDFITNTKGWTLG